MNNREVMGVHTASGRPKKVNDRVYQLHSDLFLMLGIFTFGIMIRLKLPYLLTPVIIG